MDPETCLAELQALIDKREWASAIEHLNNYYRWRLRGGFEPRDGDNRADTLANLMCDRLSD